MPWEARDKSATSVKNIPKSQTLIDASGMHVAHAYCKIIMANHSLLAAFTTKVVPVLFVKKTRQSVAIGYHSFKSEELLIENSCAYTQRAI